MSNGIDEIRACKIDIRIAPGSKKWYWFSFHKRRTTSTVVASYEWTVPGGFANEGEKLSGNKVGILLSATGDVGTIGFLELKVTTSVGESLYHRRGCKITRDAT